eukprot:TRINITY_DN17946_c0_g1_i3.p2 TRINITY_DN17946_c0_g1~~TRINITY_DN17946_c0_g1_i3.p2  ORF type:complete len:102 (-),score=25.79 TRINITY_DN17946_c0_g1_i3:1148-1453(-)
MESIIAMSPTSALISKSTSAAATVVPSIGDDPENSVVCSFVHHLLSTEPGTEELTLRFKAIAETDAIRLAHLLAERQPSLGWGAACHDGSSQCYDGSQPVS